MFKKKQGASITQGSRYLVPIFLAILGVVLILVLSITFTQTTRINIYLTEVARFERTYLESDIALQKILITPDLLGQYQLHTQRIGEAISILDTFENDSNFQDILEELPGMDEVFNGILQMRDQLLGRYLQPLAKLFEDLGTSSDLVRGASSSNLRNWLGSRISLGDFSLHAFSIINQVDILLDFKPRFFNLFTELSEALGHYLTDLLVNTSIITVVVISIISGLAIFIIFFQIWQRHHYTLELERTVKERTRELVAVQNKLVESEKFASMQKITRGLAHEFNTPLGNIITASSHLGSLLDKLDQQRTSDTLTISGLNAYLEQSAAALGIISHEVRRSSDILGILRDIQAGNEDHAVDQVDLHRICAEIGDALPARQGSKELSLHLDLDHSSSFLGYPLLVRQVLGILVTNSLEHAQAPDNKLRIRIASKLSEGGVEIMLSDNGHGIPQNEMEHIFEPFSRLRKNKTYYGLGLFTVYTIVTTRMAGSIHAATLPDGGIAFTILLPKNPGKV